MAGLDYKKLYTLQDEVLSKVFGVENEFYLTGETCLSRFYIEKRYSDDLDFFTNASPRYSFALKNIQLVLHRYFDLQILVTSKDFNRFLINGILQIDFVNDIAFHYKDVIVTRENYLVDNVENILSNKLTAVMGRDNPKDIFDIYLIAKFFPFSWQDILQAAHQKAYFCDEELIIRLKSFPQNMLDRITLADRDFLRNFDQEFSAIITSIALA